MTENPKHLLDSVSETPQKPSKIAKTAVEDFTDDEEEQQQQQEVPQEPMSPNPRIQRYLLAIEYIGIRFSGSQQQPNCRTVVGVLEVNDNYYHLYRDLNAFYRKRQHHWKAILMRDYGRTRRILSVTAVAILLVLILIQTLCSIILATEI